MKKNRILGTYFSVQKKIFLLFLLATILSSFLVGITAYYISISILKDKVSDSFRINIDFVAESVRHELSRIEQISNYLYCNTDVKDLLTNKERESYEYIKLREDIERALNSLVMSSDFHAYRLIQIRSGDDVLLDYSPSQDNGGYSFHQDRITNAFSCTPVTRSFNLKKSNDAFYKWHIPQETLLVNMRQVLDSDYREKIGQTFLALNGSIFTNIRNSYNDEVASHLYILDAENQVINGTNRVQDKLLHDFLANPPIGAAQAELDNNLIFYRPIDSYGWKVVAIIPLSDLTRDNRVILIVIFIGLIVSVILGAVLWYFLSKKIYGPLQELKRAVREVERGNLNANASVTSNDEFGELSTNFNHMVCQINDLFSSAVDEQARLKDAQYKALRAQINPHFLYNSLGSIRWMAIIHKADNIKAMVDALARLLRNSANQNSGSVRLRDEISAVKDYVFIQKLAYGCKFDVKWEIPQKLNELFCIGFILQPIVENAIFHGIEPKKTSGLITITAQTTDGILEIVVTDDGVGMTPQAIDDILKKESQNKYGLSGIGVSNVNERLILTYGADYPLKYQSEAGQYTTVTIRIPVDKNILSEGDQEHENRDDC